jgi:hypothetical protein
MLTQQSFNRGRIAQTGVLPYGQIIRDTFPLRIENVKRVVVEQAGAKRPVLRVTGVFQLADDQNQNGRVYPRKILAEAVKAIQKDLPKRVVLGEFDHPTDAKIHLDRVSHLITKVWMEGKHVYGEAEILPTDCGRNLGVLFESKVGVGISSRGVGDMEAVNEGREDEKFVVQDGYRFVTWDCVAEPSVSEAVLSVMESRQRNLNLSKKAIITRGKLRATHPEKAFIPELARWLKE